MCSGIGHENEFDRLSAGSAAVRFEDDILRAGKFSDGRFAPFGYEVDAADIPFVGVDQFDEDAADVASADSFAGIVSADDVDQADPPMDEIHQRLARFLAWYSSSIWRIVFFEPSPWPRP